MLKAVALKEIRENIVALRAVNTESEEYLGLVDSIRNRGFMGAITVRQQTDRESGQTYYELVDGLHRYSASKDAGLESINADVIALNDAEVLEAQIMANVHRIETKPVEYSKQLLRILSLNPLMTEAELASKLGKSPQWIKERLGLTKIDNPEISNLVNEGKIRLANAYALAKLPSQEMADFVDRAITLGADEFIPIVNSRVKELKDSKRKGTDASEVEFQAVAHMQKLKDLKAELETSTIARALIDITGATTAVDGFKLAIQWCLHIDPESVRIQQAKDNERKAMRAEAKKRKDAEREAKKAKDAAEAAEAAKSVLNL